MRGGDVGGGVTGGGGEGSIMFEVCALVLALLFFLTGPLFAPSGG